MIVVIILKSSFKIIVTLNLLSWKTIIYTLDHNFYILSHDFTILSRLIFVGDGHQWHFKSKFGSQMWDEYQFYISQICLTLCKPYKYVVIYVHILIMEKYY